MPSPFEWSNEMDGIFWKNVGKVVLDDPRTDWSENLSLGYPFDIIREQVLAKGLADFSQEHSDAAYGTLTPDEKVLLYCFVNMKKHFFARYATFEANRAAIEERLVSDQRATVLDIGSGPATACLALADLIPGRDFTYLGVDSALAMRNRGSAFWEAARSKGLLGKGCTSKFFASWNQLPADAIAPANPLIVVSSYFFASHSLKFSDLHSLATTLQQLTNSSANEPPMLIYTNSTNPLARRNYEVFREQLGLEPESNPPIVTIEYKKKRGGAVAGREEFVCDVIHLIKSTYHAPTDPVRQSG